MALGLRRLILLSLALPIAGCGVLSDLAALRDGLPADDDVRLALPQKAGSEALLGQPSELYALTRGVTVSVNGGVLWALALVRGIAATTPANHVGNTFTWGPSAPRNLDAKNNYRLDATLNDDGSVTYALKGKKVLESDAGWKSLITGTHTKGAAPRTGSGTLRIDWDANQKLSGADKRQVGKADATYGTKAGDGYFVDVDFTLIRDGNSDRLIDATYRFRQPAAGTGTLEFKTEKDLSGDAQLETLVVHSRWLESGRGRSDAHASGGSLAQPAQLSECWDDDFGRTFVDRSYAPAQNEGDVAACPFADALFPAP